MADTPFTRRDFICGAGAGALALALGESPAILRASRVEKPNVLFIAIDDLNDWTGCLGGHPGVHTPNIDALAESGVLFTSAHCAAPMCNPSRAALMTGIRPATSGVYANSEYMLDSPVIKSAITLSAHFRANGYRTLGAGKIYHRAVPDPEAWDSYFPSKERTRPVDPMPWGRPLNGIPDTAHFDWGPVVATKEQMGDWQVANRVIRHLEQRHKKPFFLACGFFRPHLPWYVPQEYFDMYPLEDVVLPEVPPDDLNDVPEFARRIANPTGDHESVTTHDQWREAVRGYMACISFVDECVGRVIGALDASPYRDSTIVVLWSDHGWHLGEKLHWRKFTLWEEATRNVLMFRAPGVTCSGGRCDNPAGLIDIYPTLCGLCRLEAPLQLEGESLVGQLREPSAGCSRPVLTTYGRGNHSVRSRQWRYTRYHDGTEELYDHESDRHEWVNLAGEEKHDDVKRQLSAYLPEANAVSVSELTGRKPLTVRVRERTP